MTVFWKGGFWRESVHGNLHEVEGHWVRRDEWGRTSRTNASAEEKDAWVYNYIAQNTAFETGLFPNAKCPECGNSVYFYRHKSGGCAWFDDVPWPWPKHPCMDIPNTKCKSDKLQGNGTDTGSPPHSYPPKPFWMSPISKAERFYKSWWSGRHPLSDFKFDIGFNAFFGNPLERMQGISKELVKREFTGQCENILGEPRPLKTLSYIVQYHQSCKGGIFKFYDKALGHQIMIPVKLMRSRNDGSSAMIAARSFLCPQNGLWLYCEPGMGKHRNVHAIFMWNLETPKEKTLIFINPDTGRLNWREGVKVTGAFSKVSKIENELPEKPIMTSGQLREKLVLRRK